jgi:hypothetical protein
VTLTTPAYYTIDRRFAWRIQRVVSGSGYSSIGSPPLAGSIDPESRGTGSDPGTAETRSNLTVPSTR